jgi:diguanylate cyclase (GGDEF)-like protein
MDEILAGYHGLRLSQRIRVHGTVTYFDPGVAMVLQDGDKSLWIRTRSIAPVRLGDIVDATGFPDVRDGFLNLVASEIRKRGSHAPVAALPVQWRDLVSSKHVFDLVSIEGKVVTSIREASQDEYVLVSDGDKFSAIYRHPQTGVLPLLAMAQIPVGAKVRVTGICVLDSSNPFNQDVPFNILLRSSGDISVVEQPSWLNIRNLILIVAGLLVLVAGVGAKSWALERKVRGQTKAMTVRVETEAALERRRSTILEDINESRPLAEIMEEIIELVSFKLEGVPCWCQIPGEAQLGDCPPDGHSLRVVRAEIPARSEPALGAIFVGLNPENPPVSGELEALSVGTRLATLAIETRKLYSEMRHRSEFDLLTEVHNRFSLDRYLDAKIEDARLENGVFGLIYVDLDRFKQVNDVYGHLVGDMYLREVALRLKRQLRSHDMLARLGGDEFAVLVQAIHSRAEVEEIALRLEHCFDEPFAMEGYVLHGSASIGIALYPEDGQTRDSLLSSSDAAMYVAKETKRIRMPILIEP